MARAQWPGRQKIKSDPNNHSNHSLAELSTGQWWVKRPTEQAHLLWAVPGIHYGSEHRFAAFLLNIYLGGGMSSSLFQEIREKKGLAYTVYSMLTPFVDSGIFAIYAALEPKKVPLCLKVIERCVQETKKQVLKSKDLRLIKDNLKGSLLLSADSMESRMASIAKNEIYMHRYDTVEQMCLEIEKVTAPQIKAVANSLFAKQERALFQLGPKA